MRKIVVYTLLSIDGVAESPDRFIVDFDEAMYDNLACVIGAQDTVLLGRTTYDDWAAYWPTSDHQPFADFINGVSKYVGTSRPLETQWDGASTIDGPLDEFVRDLKARPGSDIGVHGSISLARSLLHARLVDELRLVVVPALAGVGRRLLDGTDGLGTVRLLRGASTPSGAILADYRLPENAAT
jgi:dihydrofolate reductase